MGQPAPQVETKPKPVVRAPSLLPGCLVPQQQLVAAGGSVEVAVALFISAEGRVVSAELEKSSGNVELDDAFIRATSKCTFQAATENGAPIHHAYSLKFRSASSLQGLSLCFMPDYPRAALRTSAEGTVEIAFRVSEGSHEPEIRLIKSTDSRPLNAETVRTAKACLQHPAVRSSLLPNAWYSQTVVWKLE